MPAILAAVAQALGVAENGKDRTAQYDPERSAMTCSQNNRKAAKKIMQDPRITAGFTITPQFARATLETLNAEGLAK